MQRKTNDEFVNELMCFSPYGGLVQVFIIEAIRNYCERILQTPEPTEDGKGFISAIAWHRIARDMNDKMIANYEAPKDGV